MEQTQMLVEVEAEALQLLWKLVRLMLSTKQKKIQELSKTDKIKPKSSLILLLQIYCLDLRQSETLLPFVFFYILVTVDPKSAPLRHSVEMVDGFKNGVYTTYLRKIVRSQIKWTTHPFTYPCTQSSTL